jgi:hypothetical protein
MIKIMIKIHKNKSRYRGRLFHITEKCEDYEDWQGDIILRFKESVIPGIYTVVGHSQLDEKFVISDTQIDKYIENGSYKLV